MRFPKNWRFSPALAFFAALLHAQAGPQTLIRKISVSASNPPVLQIQTSTSVAPKVQVIGNPERLVIDIPNSIMAASVHGFAVDRGEVRRVRVGLFSTAPPITRIVLDLNTPQWYRIIPDESGFAVRLGTESPDAEQSGPTPTIGWVSASLPAKQMLRTSDPFVVRRTAAHAEVINGVRVQFGKGLLEIHARNANLSEVLFQIEKQTGAPIAIPAGTEQDHVVGDFGPAPAGEVLAQLLNGSDLNFVVVGSEADPNLPRSVILSRKSAADAEPVLRYTPPAASNIAPPADDNSVAPEEIVPPQPDAGALSPDREPSSQQQPTEATPGEIPQPQN